MHIEKLDLNLLTAFDAMVRERNVTRAAHGLGLSQSAMSHALNRLREFFDDQLFVNTPSGMTPTRKAEALVDPILQVMTILRQQVLSESRFDPATARRAFTLCMTDMGELVFLPPLISRLRRDAPHCTLHTLQVPVSQVEATLAGGDADLAVGSLRAAPEGLFQQRLFMHSFVTIVSARNKSVGDTLSLEEFERLPQIAVTLTGHVSGAYDNALEALGVKRNIYLTTPHFLSVPLLMDEHPDLIATVPLQLANVFEEYGRIRVVKPPVDLPTFALSQHWHPRFHHDPAVIWLRETMKETFENYPVVSVGAGVAHRPTRRKRGTASTSNSR
ncbi:LysR family transcriptional regulator [Variovorax sp. Root411]|uniref:LysR family transcriptional regulator n=1 Tax=Variovorax sp. Root411 TaxID=1736530 RepID=UPI000700503C|nr:LysR family transcriptional regulator [Variovorax sp. Root411]KQW64919.1 ABC transporter substrate-binding protein [Variovorax sp. Root411]